MLFSFKLPTSIKAAHTRAADESFIQAPITLYWTGDNPKRLTYHYTISRRVSRSLTKNQLLSTTRHRNAPQTTLAFCDSDNER